MSPWLRTRRATVPLAATIACALALAALQDRYFAMPVAVGTDGMVLWSTFIPLIWALGIADCFASKTQSVELRPARRTLVLDAGLFLALTGIGVGAVLGATRHDSSTGIAGHMLILAGVACVFAARAGAATGALACTALLIITCFYGRNAPAGPYIRILQPDGDPIWALAVGTLACLTALAVLLLDGGTVRLGATYRLHD